MPCREYDGRMNTLIRLSLPCVLFCVAFVLGACSISFDRSELPPNPIPNGEQQRVLGFQILKIVESMKGAKSVEISDAGPNEAQSGPELWTMCARVAFPSRSLNYTFFVRSEKVVEWRPDVVNDRCESRNYRAAALGSSTSIY